MNLDELVSERVRPVLDHMGFRAKGRGGQRTTDGFAHRVEITRGQRSAEGRFCINLYAHPLITAYAGLPNFPLRPGDYWLSRRLAPAGLDDQWWASDHLTMGDVDQIVRLIDGELTDWFAELQCLSRFSQDWFRRVLTLDQAAAGLGLLPARLAYLQAAVFAEQGNTAMAARLADTACEQAGPQATTFLAWVKQFQAGLTDC